MTLSVGIDFGTSNSTVGLALPTGRIDMVPLEAEHISLPTCLFFNMDRGPQNATVLFGREALSHFHESRHGRLLRSLKSVLGTGLAHESTVIGSKAWKLEDVLTLFLSHLKTKAERVAQAPLTQVVVGRPVFFVDNNPAADTQAETQLRHIAQRAGFTHVEFQYEPLAAARAYEQQVTQEELVLVADLGGGTADFSIIRLSPEGREQEDRARDIVGYIGIHIGGTDLDRVLSFKELMPHLGRGTRYTDKNLEMPNAPFYMLSTWHKINMLYTDAALADINEMLRHAQETAKLARLYDVVEKRNGHALLGCVEAAKIALTDKQDVELNAEALLPALHLVFQRDRFEEAIADQVKGIRNILKTLFTQVGSPNDIAGRIQTVFFTGGTSAVPAVREAILSCVPEARVVDGDPATAVGRGLAIEAGLRFRGMSSSCAHG